MITATQITERHDFASRQANYYADAARYLGFLNKPTLATYRLTKKGEEFLAAPLPERDALVIDAIAARPATRALVEALNGSGVVTDAALERILKRMRRDVRGTTIPRRVQTIKRWCSLLLGGADPS